MDEADSGSNGIQKSYQQSGAAEQNTKASAQREEHVAVAKADPQGWHPQEENHRAEERKYWKGQRTAAALGIALTLCAAGGGIASAIFAALALKASWDSLAIAQKGTDAAWNSVAIAQKGTDAAWQAVEQSRRQAEVAEAQLVIAKETEQDARAPNMYAVAGIAKNTEVKVARKVSAFAVYYNSGPGISYKVKTYGRFDIFKDSEAASKIASYKFSPLSDIEGITLLPATMQNSFRMTVWSEKELTSIDIKETCDNCNSSIYLYGQVDFKDYLGTNYSRYYCGFITRTTDNKLQFNICNFHNYQEPVNTGLNIADRKYDTVPDPSVAEKKDRK